MTKTIITRCDTFTDFSDISLSVALQTTVMNDNKYQMYETEDENLLFKPIFEWVKQRFWQRKEKTNLSKMPFFAVFLQNKRYLKSICKNQDIEGGS